MLLKTIRSLFQTYIEQHRTTQFLKAHRRRLETYPVSVVRIRETGGRPDWFHAYCSDLGSWTCVGDGRTWQEAIRECRKMQAWLIQDWLRRGVKIPEPTSTVQIEHLDGDSLRAFMAECKMYDWRKEDTKPQV